MGTFSGGKATYGLTAGGTATGVNVSMTGTVGQSPTVHNFVAGDIAYAFQVKTTTTPAQFGWDASTGAVTQTAGLGYVTRWGSNGTDNTALDFEGQAIATKYDKAMLLMVAPTTNTAAVTVSDGTNYVSLEASAHTTPNPGVVLLLSSPFGDASTVTIGVPANSESTFSIIGATTIGS